MPAQGQRPANAALLHQLRGDIVGRPSQRQAECPVGLSRQQRGQSAAVLAGKQTVAAVASFGGRGAGEPQCPQDPHQGLECDALWTTRGISPIALDANAPREGANRCFLHRPRSRNAIVEAASSQPMTAAGDELKISSPAWALGKSLGFVSEVAGHRQERSVAHGPARDDRPGADHLGPKSASTVEAGHDLRPAQLQQLRVEGPHFRGVLTCNGSAPFEGCRVIGVGNGLARLFRRESREMRKFPAAPLADGDSKLSVVIGEVKKGRRTSVLLAHEQQGNVRAQ